MSGNRIELRYTKLRGDRKKRPRDDVRINERICEVSQLDQEFRACRRATRYSGS